MKFFIETNLRTSIFIVLGATLLFCTGCTRSDKNEGRVSISIPTLLGKVSSLSEEQKLVYVVINVKNRSTSKVSTTSWSGCHECNSIPTPPANFTFDVDSGSHLIQALAVYRTETGGMFLYDDSIEDLSGTSKSVTLNLEKLGGANQSLADGRIVGRYLTGTNVGPTDIVNIIYNPGVGKEPMILMKSSIVNGWFNFFALEGQRFTYKTEGGIELFKNANYLDDEIFKPGTGKPIALVKIPAHQRERQEDVDGDGSWESTWEDQEASNFVVGWWGNASTLTANKYVCYSADEEPVTYARNSVSDPELLWSPASTITSDVRISGGTPDTNTSVCNNPSRNTAIEINPAQLNDRDGLGGARGAFAAITVNDFGYKMTTVATAAEAATENDVKANMYLLPGAQSLFTGVKVYGSAEEFRSAEDGAPCEQLAAGNLSNIFTHLTDVPMSSAVVGDSGLYELPIEISNAYTADEEPKYRQLAVCPYDANKTTGGVFVYEHVLYPYFSGEGEGMANVVPTEFNVRSSAAYYNETCVPVDIELVGEYIDPHGGGNFFSPSYNETDVDVEITSTDALLKFYQTNDCADIGQSIVNKTVPAHSHEFTVYAKSDCSEDGQCASASHSFSMNGLNSDGDPMSGSSSLDIRYASSQSYLDVSGYTIEAMNPQYENQCRPFYVVAYNTYTGSPVNVPFSTSAAVNLTLTSNDPSAVTFYNDGACTNVTSAFSSPANTTRVGVYYKVNASNGSQFTVSASDGTLSATFLMSVGSPLPPTSVDMYRLDGGSFSSIGIGTCFEVQLSLKDANGMYTSSNQDYSVQVSNYSDTQYLTANETDCATTTNTSPITLTIPLEQSSVSYWIRKNGGGTEMNVNFNNTGNVMKSIF